MLYEENSLTVEQAEQIIGEKMIKRIWLKIMIPVSRNTKIVIPRLKINRKKTMPKRLITCGMVRLWLFCSSISAFTAFSRSFPSFREGLIESRASTRSSPSSSMLLLPNWSKSQGCLTWIENKVSLIKLTLSSLSESGAIRPVPKSRAAVLISEENSFTIFIVLGA